MAFSCFSPKVVINVNDSIEENNHTSSSSFLSHQAEKTVCEFQLSKESNPRIATESLLADDRLLKVYTVTWNLHGALPLLEDAKPLFPETEDFHVISINTQECERSIAASFVNSSKEGWEAILQQACPPKYIFVCGNTLNAIHLALFVNKNITKYIKDVYTSNVPTGFARIAGNKGAVATALLFANTSILFLSCHFCAQEQNVQERINDWKRTDCEIANKFGPILKPSGTLKDQFDHVLLCGDFNFRVDLAYETAIELAKDSANIPELLKNDQLTKIRASTTVFDGYFEGKITFLPTYKFDELSTVYDTSEKKRIPSWTDRILFTDKPVKVTFKNKEDSQISNSNENNPGVTAKIEEITHIQLLEYESLDKVLFSDHRAVYAKLLIPVDVGIDHS